MIHIAICDDDALVCKKIKSSINLYADRSEQLTDISIFNWGEELINALKENKKFDLIFLDIELGEINGVETAKYIRDKLDNQISQIVFISSKTIYAMSLFEVRPFNFIVKPITDEKISDCIEKYLSIYPKHEMFKYMIHKESFSVEIDKIMYFQSFNRIIIIHCIDGNFREFYGKISDIEPREELKTFILIHKSYLINPFYIKLTSYDSITLTNGEILNISQQYRKDVRKMLLKRNSENIKGGLKND